MILEAAFQTYEQTFEKMTTYQNERMELVNNVLNKIGPVMEKTLTGIMKSAEGNQDSAVELQTGLALRNLLLGRLYVTKYLDTNDQMDAQRVQNELREMDRYLNTLSTSLNDPDQRQLLADISKNRSLYAQKFNHLVSVINERNNLIDNTLDRIGPEIAALTENIKQSYLSEQNRLGPELVESNHRSITLIEILGVGAFLFGIVFAAITTLSLTRALRMIIDSLNDNSVQMTSASSQVSSASQQLAEGASEQAASLEETSSSLEEMSSMTKQNADNANQADNLMREVKQVVDHTNISMTELNASIDQISEASEETFKIIKTIDEIAFQTNLLALNAAVEAARAGEAGAGFAVVADEVRNLALRSAEAAKNTSYLIENTVKLITDGSVLVKKTSDAFTEVTANTVKGSDFVAEIAAASNEQAQGINQINRAIGEMDQVIQQNASSAEENASASEEMSAQADHMKITIDQLVSLVGKKNRKADNPSNRFSIIPFKNNISGLIGSSNTTSPGTDVHETAF